MITKYRKKGKYSLWFSDRKVQAGVVRRVPIHFIIYDKSIIYSSFFALYKM